MGILQFIFSVSDNSICEYSEHLKTGPTGFGTVIFRTLFKSGFRMVKGSHFVKTIQKPDKKSGF
jgi:hypothetical protein